ncbi:MAG: type I polyketide synthase, partial [Gammaproteobacteria bacterium]|nr:type I polyketide synthase [Gammaproteobacteria bacterium]
MTKKIAIVGYSFRLPQTSRERFWDDLLDSKNMISEIPKERWSFENHLHPDKTHPGTSYTFKAGTLGDVSGFDAEFFGISPREAAVVDPQQRYLLEMTWEAIEHAGIKPNSLKGTDTGVYLGMSSIDYAFRMTGDLSCIKSSSATGNTTSIAANRISYAFDLKGPSLSMDTACSSSLYAFHHACQAIRSGEISTAIAGGISLLLHPFSFIMFSKATMLSPDGECRFCDASANGYVRSEGGGIFILKDYELALQDGDLIHAVVAGSGVNTDGFTSGITIPSWQSQQELMEKVYKDAGINPVDIDYLEAHGTGTPVGDPIETRAIGQALAQQRKKPLYIGSIKANLGHLEPASGVAGLVKALHVLKHRAIPPTSSMKTPNPNILFDEWNILLTDKLTSLKDSGQLTVGINSFGFGGANAHVVLQSHEPSPVAASNTVSSVSKRLPWIITGNNQQAIEDNARKLAEYLDDSSPLYDTAWQYANHKQRLNQGVVFFAETYAETQNRLIEILEDKNTSDIVHGQSQDISKGAVFVYSGNGCQWEGMGNILLQESTLFRQTIDEIDSIFSTFCNSFSIKEELALLNGRGRYALTEIAQPALFAIQVAVTRYLTAKGIRPVAVTGHSVGEVAAAWACGALSLTDAVKVIYYRSHFQGQTQGSGRMTAISLSDTEIQDLLAQLKLDKLHIAGINSDTAVTLAGDAEQLSILETYLAETNVFHSPLPLDYAFHSPEMDSIQQPLLDSLNEIIPQKSTIPFISTVTGEAINTEKLDARYWWDNIREPVMFKQALDCLFNNEHNCFIEVGAHPVLRYYLDEQQKSHQRDARIIPTLTRNNG